MKPILYFVLLLFPATILAQPSDNRVAILISGNGNAAAPDLSYDLEELAQAYLVLHDNGVDIDIVSPKGGAVLIKDNKDSLEYIQHFKSLAHNQLRNTLTASEIDHSDYAGIFIIGGGGAMIDLPTDQGTQTLLTQFAQSNAVITAVCHGPAAIADTMLANGRYLVEGKRVTSFTNTEELAFSKESADAFPFLVEDKLVENGGIFVSNAAMLPYVAVDDNLITAQNPGAVAAAAETMLIKLGLKPKQRTLFHDEATMALVSQARVKGPVTIDIALAKSPEKYDVNYLALYGFYAYQLADDSAKPTELALMKTIAHHFQHPMFESALIKALIEQGQIEAAKSTFETFRQRYPEHEHIRGLAAMLSA